MADRILEIKSLLAELSYNLATELEVQRKEIQELKDQIKVLESKLSQQQTVALQQPAQARAAAAVEAPAQPRPEQKFRPSEPVVLYEEEPVDEDPEDETLPEEEPEEDRSLLEEPVPVRRPYSAPREEESFFTVTDLNEANSTPVTTVADLFADRNTIADVACSQNIPWMVDIPGPKVELVQSAFSFNDRLNFMRELFDGDSEQFNITLDRINETDTFDEVVADMRDMYPEWDEESDLVYHFYMAVRRKFRD